MHHNFIRNESGEVTRHHCRFLREEAICLSRAYSEHNAAIARGGNPSSVNDSDHFHASPYEAGTVKPKTVAIFEGDHDQFILLHSIFQNYSENTSDALVEILERTQPPDLTGVRYAERQFYGECAGKIAAKLAEITIQEAEAITEPTEVDVSEFLRGIEKLTSDAADNIDN